MKKKQNIFMIAEIGLNGNGSVPLAKQLIDMAYECGCDAVKFQKRNLKICIPNHLKNKIRNTPWGEMTYYEYKKRMEFDENEYDAIDAYCKELGIEWFASAWDISSLKFLKKYGCPYNKVASAMITNPSLINEIAKEGKKTFISTAMCDMGDIRRAVGIFKENLCPFVLMHCVGIYPTPNNKLNLNMISRLAKEFGCEVGYSDHSSGILAPIIAATQGATVIEKHITLDRTMQGSDHASSLERHGLELMVRDLRDLPSFYGDGKKELSGKESKKLSDLKYW